MKYWPIVIIGSFLAIVLGNVIGQMIVFGSPRLGAALGSGVIQFIAMLGFTAIALIVADLLRKR